MTGFGKQMMLLVCLSLAASQARAADRLAKPAAAPLSNVADVSLAQSGGLTGRFVTSAGVAVDGALVVLSQGDDVLAKSTTDAHGLYRFEGVRQGIYKITVGHQSQMVRIWDEQSAPPYASALVTTVHHDHVVRSQGAGGLATTIGIVGGVTGVALGGYAISVAKDAEDEAHAARKQMQSMETELVNLLLNVSP